MKRVRLRSLATAERRAASTSVTRARSRTGRKAGSCSGATPPIPRVGSAIAVGPPARFGSTPTEPARSRTFLCPTAIHAGRCGSATASFSSPITKASATSIRARSTAPTSRGTRTKASTTRAFRRPTASASFTRPAPRSCVTTSRAIVRPASILRRARRRRKPFAASRRPQSRSSTTCRRPTERTLRSSPAAKSSRCRSSKAPRYVMRPVRGRAPA